MKTIALHALVLAALLASLSCAKPAPPDFQKKFQEDLIAAKPGSVIDLPEGKFHLDRTISLTVDGVTIRGKGMDKTILSFAGQQTGAQGLLIKANNFTIEDLAVEDSAGDALTIQGADGVTVRRVRAEWTRGPNPANGPYAIYPVECKNVLVEDSIARGAADAGIYVGQTENVVLRRNRSEFNVDGFEIENSVNVDAYENIATHNSGGMGVFNLPNFPKQGGHHVRVYNNQVMDNNNPNFAPRSLGPIYYLPTGTGVYVMAIKEVEVFNNKIHGNNTANVYIIHYLTGVEDAIKDAASSEITRMLLVPDDPRYYPYTQEVYVHDNDVAGGGTAPDVRNPGLQMLAKAVGGKLPDILYDGMVDKKWPAGPNAGQICLAKNGDAGFLNFDRSGGGKHLSRDVKKYACTLPPLEASTVPQLAASPAGGAQ